jgi:hypothetical protein
MLTAAHCIQGSENENFTYKLIIINPSKISPEFCYSDYQLVQCTRDDGTSVRGKELYSGVSVVCDRHQILGVVDETKLPQWAKTKLEIQRDPSIFKYANYHFKPERKFDEHDGDFNNIMRNVQSDCEWCKTEYSHNAFYDASGNSEADIFKCVENGKLYVPCANELFIYENP